ncbi:MAG: GtrA family protein [Candidatus Magasanikbacteria bacterium]
MMKIFQKVKNFLCPHRRQFAKYSIVGVSGFVIDLGLLILVKETFLLNPTLAVVLTQIVVLVYNFVLNKFWTFRNKDIPHKQLIRYAVLASFNYLLGVLVMYIFNEIFDFDYRLVRLGTVMAMVLWNFLLYKYWVYK